MNNTTFENVISNTQIINTNYSNNNTTNNNHHHHNTDGIINTHAIRGYNTDNSNNNRITTPEPGALRAILLLRALVSQRYQIGWRRGW